MLLASHFDFQFVIVIQSKGVIANAKHWVENNQETDRSGGNEVVDERTRWEMYYPPFLGAIKAEVGSIMCSYNRINGDYSCGNNETLVSTFIIYILNNPFIAAYLTCLCPARP